MDILLLQPSQVTKDILNILNVLSPTTNLSITEARNIITMQRKNLHFTYVLYLEGEPAAMGSFIILNKLGNNGGRSALIEDIAVRKDLQGSGYGLTLVKFLVKKCISYKVYKILLNCVDELIPFYEKAGFGKRGNLMRMDVD